MKSILLVDDSPLVQSAARLALEEAGFAVATRGTFDELMSEPIEGHDLILMDVQMPELYGDDVAMVLRHERGVTIPIYLFSSLAPAELAERAESARVDGFISKNEDLSQVVARVREILGTKQ